PLLISEWRRNSSPSVELAEKYHPHHRPTSDSLVHRTTSAREERNTEAVVMDMKDLENPKIEAERGDMKEAARD
ncbi:Hypothetical predicted protein, partial [Olea europaea subsp. europaea]